MEMWVGAVVGAEIRWNSAEREGGRQGGRAAAACGSVIGLAHGGVPHRSRVLALDVTAIVEGELERAGVGLGWDAGLLVRT